MLVSSDFSVLSGVRGAIAVPLLIALLLLSPTATEAQDAPGAEVQYIGFNERGAHQIGVCWGEPHWGAPDSYDVEWSPEKAGVYRPFSPRHSDSEQCYAHSGLLRNTEYWYRARAVWDGQATEWKYGSHSTSDCSGDVNTPCALQVGRVSLPNGFIEKDMNLTRLRKDIDWYRVSLEAGRGYLAYVHDAVPQTNSDAVKLYDSGGTLAHTLLLLGLRFSAPAATSAQTNPSPAACGLPAGGSIILAATYTLTADCTQTSGLEVSSNVTLTVNGAGYTINASGIPAQGFVIRTSTDSTLNLNQVTIDGASIMSRALIETAYGGTGGELNANGVTFRGSSGPHLSIGGSASLTSVLFEDNVSRAFYFSESASGLNVSRTGGAVTITNAVFRNNYDGGGAIVNESSNGSVTTNGCLTFSGNIPYNVVGAWTDNSTGPCSGTIGNGDPAAIAAPAVLSCGLPGAGNLDRSASYVLNADCNLGGSPSVLWRISEGVNISIKGNGYRLGAGSGSGWRWIEQAGGGTLTLRNVVVDHARMYSFGTLIVDHSTFRDTSDRVFYHLGTATFRDSLFENIVTTRTGGNASVLLVLSEYAGGNATFTNAVFRNNTSGGAPVLNTSGSSTITLNGCITFENNTSPNYGGNVTDNSTGSCSPGTVIGPTGPVTDDPPGWPRNLILTSTSSSQIDLSWDEPSGDPTGYEVQWALYESDTLNPALRNVSPRHSGTATSYSHTGLSASRDYMYMVRAVNANGAGLWSEQKLVRTQPLASPTGSVPGRPWGAWAQMMSQRRIDVGWAAPDGNPTGYEIQWARWSSGAYNWKDVHLPHHGVETYYRDILGGWDPLAVYFYRVRAVNANGKGGWSQLASLTTWPAHWVPVSVPAAPESLVVLTHSNHQLHVIWGVPNGQPHRYWLIWSRSPHDWSENRLVYVDGGQTIDYIFDVPNNLRGEKVYFRVRGENDEGPGAWSKISSGSTTAPHHTFELGQAGSDPRDLSGYPHQIGTQLYWKKPEIGGDSVTGYQILRRRPAQENSMAVYVENTGRSDTHFEDRNVVDGVTYVYRVVARWGFMLSGSSNFVKIVAVAADQPVPPGAPDSAFVSVVSDSVIDVFWFVVPWSSGYEVEYSSDGGATWQAVDPPDSGTDSWYQHSGLTALTTYHYRARALKDGVASEWSPVVSGTTLAAVAEEPTATPTPLRFQLQQSEQEWSENTGPGRQPRSLSAEASSAGITLNWEAPATAASEVDGYQILRRRPHEGEDALLVYAQNTGSAATTYTDSSVIAGVMHVYRVKAIRERELSGVSNYVNVVAVPVAAQQNYVNVVAEPVAAQQNSAPAATNTPLPTATATPVPPTNTPTATATPTSTLTPLPTNTPTHTPTAVPSDTPVPQPPSAPRNLVVSASGGQIRLDWDAPATGDVVGYRILRRRPLMGERTLMVYEANTGSASTTWTDSNVTAGTRHTYRVIAIGADGQLSKWSNYDRATP